MSFLIQSLSFIPFLPLPTYNKLQPTHPAKGTMQRKESHLGLREEENSRYFFSRNFHMMIQSCQMCYMWIVTRWQTEMDHPKPRKAMELHFIKIFAPKQRHYA